MAEIEYQDFKESVWTRFQQGDDALAEHRRKTREHVVENKWQTIINELKDNESMVGMGIPGAEQPNTLMRDNPWEQGCSAQDPTRFFTLREFIVNVLQQETHDKFIDLETRDSNYVMNLTVIFGKSRQNTSF